MEMGCVGMRSRGGVGVGTFSGTAFFGTGGVVETVDDDVELVELVDGGEPGGCCAMALGLRRPRDRWECSVLATVSRLHVGAKSHGARKKRKTENYMWPFLQKKY